MDSHMFQTVGHGLIERYNELISREIKIFRRRIRKGSKVLEMNYPEYKDRDKASEDEVECLRALLSFVKEKMPEVDAVCSGAILSDYQRLRVERVCSELGVVSLAYAWKQAPQRELLDVIIGRAQIEAVLVKVAAMGLEPRRDLGKTLRERREVLRTIEEEYGSHSCGEGGEFETLVLDCPFFTRARVVIEESEVVVTSDDRFAPSGHLKINKISVVAKNTNDTSGGNDGDGNNNDIIWVPDDYVAPPVIYTYVDKMSKSSYVENPDVTVHLRSINNDDNDDDDNNNNNNSSSSSSSSSSSRTIWIECRIGATADEAFNELEMKLQKEGQDWSLENHATMTHCYLRTMDDFTTFNAAYSRHFRGIEPSARACVAAPLRENVTFILSTLLCRSPRNKSLHVASISSWAPACIGPYAQLCGVGPFLFVAGQIGMQPCNLNLERNKIAEAKRCVKSCHQIREEICKNNGSEKIAFSKQAVQTIFYASKSREENNTDNNNTDDDEDELINLTIHDISFREYLLGDVWNENERYCDPIFPPEEEEMIHDDELEKDMMMVLKSIDEKDDDYFRVEKMYGLFMSLFLTMPMLPKNAAMEIEPILASSFVFPSLYDSDDDDDDDEINTNSNAIIHHSSRGECGKYEKFIGVRKKWARALVFFELKYQTLRTKVVEDVLNSFVELYELPGFETISTITAYYVMDDDIKSEEETKKFLAPLDDALSFGLRRLACVKIPVLACGFLEKKTGCKLVLEIAASID